MRKSKKIQTKHTSEFELDLAPLLAVMVKLVPVLLISSAFMQTMVIETELPQVVSEAIQRQDDKKIPTHISMSVDAKRGITITVVKQGKETAQTVPLKDGSFDLQGLHSKLVELKKVHPEVFKIDINPEGDIPYENIVKIMDEARQARDANTKFPVFDTKLGKNVDTHYMFPEIVFANTMEG